MTVRRIRLLAATALLALLTAACQMTVDVTTAMGDDGRGTFRIVFAFDKEFIEVVRSTEQGSATLDELAETGEQFGGTGWTVRQTRPQGGLRIDISRSFDDPGELERALREVERESGDRALSFPSVFRDFRIDHSSSFFRTSAEVTGSVDLRPERLVPGADAGEELRAALRQAARDVFRFRVSLDLPGRVGRYRGDPERVSGGSIVWTVPFGDRLEFAASSDGFKTSSLLIVLGPAAALLAGAAIVPVRRRRRERAIAVPGWDVPREETAPPADSASVPSAPRGDGDDDSTHGGSE
ncbi:MAG TPA: hypothetical protein VM841_12440 [Actinomycetota bacterium]|nr:hypothetical protein [Actinomycetota bacterium]